MDEPKQAAFVHGGGTLRQAHETAERAIPPERQRLDHYPGVIKVFSTTAWYGYPYTFIERGITMRKYFETTSRKLEQFFFLHGIRHSGQHKNTDGMNVWECYLDVEGRRVLEEWREIISRRKDMTGRKAGL